MLFVKIFGDINSKRTLAIIAVSKGQRKLALLGLFAEAFKKIFRIYALYFSEFFEF